MGKNYMANEKEKKRKKMNKKITINKDNKKVNSLIAFIGELEHSNPLLNSKTKTRES